MCAEQLPQQSGVAARRNHRKMYHGGASNWEDSNGAIGEY